jgi:hypothetical protein
MVLSRVLYLLHVHHGTGPTCAQIVALSLHYLHYIAKMQHALHKVQYIYE